MRLGAVPCRGVRHYAALFRAACFAVLDSFVHVVSSYQVPAELSLAHQLSSAQLSSAVRYCCAALLYLFFRTCQISFFLHRFSFFLGFRSLFFFLVTRSMITPGPSMMSRALPCCVLCCILFRRSQYHSKYHTTYRYYFNTRLVRTYYIVE